MTAAPERAPLFSRRDLRPALGLFALGVALLAGTAALSAARTEVPLAALAAYYDGYLYLDIARSFPVPYAPEALDYAGHAPGYPALVYASRLLLPDPLAPWGLLMLVLPWLAGALSPVAFYALCRATGTEPFWPSVFFLLANPFFPAFAATAHPEPIAVLLAIAALVAFLRERPLACGALLAAATVVRYPALLLAAPVGFCWLFVARRRDLRHLVALALPFAGLLAVNAYLAWRIPGFRGIRDAHSTLWDPSLTLPFAAWWRHSLALWAAEPVVLSLTYALLLVYLSSIWVGLRDRPLLVLPLWVGTVVLFQVSLTDPPAVFAFARLTFLAWPAALLVLWRRFGGGARASVAAPLAALLGALGVWLGVENVRGATHIQGTGPAIERFVAAEEPVWLDLRTPAKRLLGRAERALPGAPGP